MAFFEKQKTVRIDPTVEQMCLELANKFPEDYYNAAHVLRAAVIKLHSEKMNQIKTQREINEEQEYRRIRNQREKYEGLAGVYNPNLDVNAPVNVQPSFEQTRNVKNVFVSENQPNNQKPNNNFIPSKEPKYEDFDRAINQLVNETKKMDQSPKQTENDPWYTPTSFDNKKRF